jgi:hypothetical protein
MALAELAEEVAKDDVFREVFTHVFERSGAL